MTPTTPPDDGARADLINRTIGLRTLGQIDDVRARIADWLRAHPSDDGLRAVDARLVEMAQTLETDSPASYAYLTDVDTQTREPLPPTETVTGPAENSAGTASGESVAGQA